MEAKFIIYRFNPSKDAKAYFKDYIFDIDNCLTILDGLIKIQETLDATLSFRHSCRSAICGSCALRVNGRAVLACKTKIKAEIDKFGEIKIEPLKNMKIFKDLVVDFQPLFKQIKKIEPWIKPKTEAPKEIKERIMQEEEVQKIYKSLNCILCNCCDSDCPVFQNDEYYLGPATLTKAYRFVNDSRDASSKKRLKELEKLGIWYCAHAENCVSRCPKDIKPKELIAKLRERMIKEGVKNSFGARHVISMFKSIKKIGELDEARLPVRTFGLLRSYKFIPLGLRLILKWKLPPIFPKKIKKVDQVKKIYNELNK